jgi:hypothetical protein
VWLLVGVFVLLGGQQGVAGTRDQARPGQQYGQRHEQPADRGSGRAALPRVDRYVAIGDSYTSGAGIPPAYGGCLRSDRSYPHRVAEALGARLLDASCSGAETEHVDRPQPTADGVTTNPPQGRRLDGRTDLVTVSLGANDSRLMVFLTECVQVAPQDPTGVPCRAANQSPGGDTRLALLPAVGADLERVLRRVADEAPHARVVVVGYPQLAPPSGTCAELPVAAGDYAYVAEFMVRLDAVVRAAARSAGATYVSLLGPSAGHDICAGEDAWVLGVQPSARAVVFHPFAAEQRAVARLVVDALGDETSRQHRQ